MLKSKAKGSVNTLHEAGGHGKRKLVKSKINTREKLTNQKRTVGGHAKNDVKIIKFSSLNYYVTLLTVISLLKYGKN